MADRTFTVALRADVQGLVSGFSTARRSVEDFAKSSLSKIQKNEQAISQLSTTAGVAGAALSAFALLGVKRFADFDQAMSAVAATGAEARASIDALREAAIQAGAETVFSATEAANAVEELAKAGVSSADILGGGLDGALNLAAAGSLGLADAASYTAVALQQFRLGGQEASHVADLLAAGAGKAMGDVSDLGEALSQGGLVASQVGLTLEETTGALAAFAQAGLLGSDAGTSLKTMLQRLTPESDEAAEQFEKLGVSAYDSSGQFVGLAEFAGDLQGAMKSLTPEARNAALSVMFGADAVRAANVLYTEGEGGVRRWIKAVDDQGYAAGVAGAKLDNLKGDLEGLSGSVETALIGLGEGANGPLRQVVQTLDSLVDGFNRLDDPVKNATMLIAGGGGLALLGLAGMSKLTIGISNTRTAMQSLGLSARTASVAVAGVGGALGLATLAVSAWASAQADAKALTDEFSTTLDAFGQRTDETVSKVNEKLTEITRSSFNGSNSLARQGEIFGLTTDDLRGYVLGVEESVDRVNDAYATYKRETFGSGIAGFFNRLGNEDAFAGFRNALDKQAASLTEAEKAAVLKADADERAGVKTEQAAASTERLTSTLNVATGATQELTDAQVSYLDSIAGSDASFISLRDAMDSVIEKNRDLAQARADATKKNTDDSWETYYDGLSFSLGDYLSELQKQVELQSQWEQNMLKLAGRGVTQESLDGLRQMGPEGASLVSQLVDASDDELERFESLYSNAGASSTSAFADALTSAAPVVAAAGEQVGQEAVDAIVRRLVAGESTLQDEVNRYALIVAGMRTGEVRPSVRPGQVSAFADGGYTGDGGKYEPAGIVHRGEFVVNAAATKGNRALLEGINRGYRGYADGGYVGGLRPMAGPQVVTVPVQVTNESSTPWTIQHATFTDRAEAQSWGRRRRAEANTGGHR